MDNTISGKLVLLYLLYQTVSWIKCPEFPSNVVVGSPSPGHLKLGEFCSSKVKKINIVIVIYTPISL